MWKDLSDIQKDGMRRQFKMVAQKDPELTSSHRHNKYTTRKGAVPSDKNLRTSWTPPPQRRKGLC